MAGQMAKVMVGTLWSGQIWGPLKDQVHGGKIARRGHHVRDLKPMLRHLEDLIIAKLWPLRRFHGM